ncbi:MAG: NifB/NifX family molybdenum-iron cluster-binding protein [Solobacterium sp.]|nr:NifB/NifX family molybdenum-iron cluster-binding protein [Solobacterium sp.]
MKIAVTYENGEIFQHFGRTEQFRIYDVQDGTVVDARTIGTDGQGHGALAGVLMNAGVDALICGGIGIGARNALEYAGIRLYPGIAGSADAAVEALLQGTLDYDPDTRCDHHDHDHGACGHDGCHHGEA